MKMRRATPDDALALAKIHIDSWRAAYRDLVPDAHLASLDYVRRAGRFRESLATNSEKTYLPDGDGPIPGFLTLGACRDADVDHESTGEIWGIYLAPEYWRKGIGRAFFTWAEANLASHGYSTVVLWAFSGNRQGRRFYEAMDFRPDGATRILNRGKELEVMRFRKQLLDAERQNTIVGCKRMKITYRTAKGLSSRTVRSFFRRTEWNDWFSTSDVESYLKSAVLVVSAWHSRKLVGIGILTGDGKIEVKLDALVVDAAYQRKGIGTAMLGRIVKKVEKLRPYWFMTDVCEDHTEKLYARCGFRPNTGQRLLFHNPTYQRWGPKANRDRKKRKKE